MATDEDVAPAAALHASEVAEGFLPTLGEAFLRRVYRRVVRHPRSFLLVSESAGSVVGMAGATEDVGSLYRAFLLRDGVVATAVAAPRVLRALPRAVETVRYPSRQVGAGLPRAELLAIAVAPAARGQGLGQVLVQGVTSEFRRRGVEAVRVVTAAANEPALRMYGACGFVPVARVQVHAGVWQTVLVWSAEPASPSAGSGPTADGR